MILIERLILIIVLKIIELWILVEINHWIEKLWNLLLVNELLAVQKVYIIINITIENYRLSLLPLLL